MNAIRDLLAIVEGTRQELAVRDWCNRHVRTITHEHILREDEIRAYPLAEAQSIMLRQVVKRVAEDLVANNTETSVRHEHGATGPVKITSREITLLIGRPTENRF